MHNLLCHSAVAAAIAIVCTVSAAAATHAAPPPPDSHHTGPADHVATKPANVDEAAKCKAMNGDEKRACERDARQTAALARAEAERSRIASGARTGH